MQGAILWAGELSCEDERVGDRGEEILFFAARKVVFFCEAGSVLDFGAEVTDWSEQV